MIWLLVTVTAYPVWLGYIFSGSLMSSYHEKPKVLNAIWCWTKWPALGAVIWWLVRPIVQEHKAPSPWDIVLFLVGLYVWWTNKDSGDDDTKKHLRRFTESVKEVGGRLVVVPAPAT